MFDLTNLVMYFNPDANASNFIGIKNKLPKNYKPKIRIVVNRIGSQKKLYNIWLFIILKMIIIIVFFSLIIKYLKKN